jgi:alpha-beta hydrolase superfamily lysophospholipase
MTTTEATLAPPRRKRRWRRRVLYVIAFLFLAVNFVAFMHAWRMTHMVDAGVRTATPAQLSTFGKIKIFFTGVNVPKPVNRRVPDLPFTAHRYQTPDGETLEAWHIPADQAQRRDATIVIFHGYTAAKSAMLMQAKLFHSLGFDVFLVDFRGAGGSTGQVTTVGGKESIDVKASVDFLRASNLITSTLVLYGDSMGAAAITRAVAVDGVQADALILEQPYNSLYTTTKHRFESMGVPSFPLAGLLVFWGGVQNGFWAFDLCPREYASHITCPTLYIRGDHDPWITLDESQQVFDAIQGRKELLTIQTNRHDALWPREKDKWVGAVKDFLDTIPQK